MPNIIYTPKSLNDLQEIKTYITRQFGGNRAKICVRKITSTVRQLEIFPEEGPSLENLIEYPTDYHYLYVKPNYIFYRIDDDTVRIIRILNEKQDFLQILFGISSVSNEGDEYWSRNEW